jgi:hypothetical protein
MVYDVQRYLRKGIRLSNQLTVLEEEDILRDRKGAPYVRYSSYGMGCGAHAAALGSGQSLKPE